MKRNNRPANVSVLRAILVLPFALIRAIILSVGKIILSSLQLLDRVLVTGIHTIVFYFFAVPVKWIFLSVDAFLEAVCAVVAGKELHSYLSEEAKQK